MSEQEFTLHEGMDSFAFFLLVQERFSRGSPVDRKQRCALAKPSDGVVGQRTAPSQIPRTPGWLGSQGSKTLGHFYIASSFHPGASN